VIGPKIHLKVTQILRISRKKFYVCCHFSTDLEYHDMMETLKLIRWGDVIYEQPFVHVRF
jgi:hypothetical protein